MKKFLAIFLTAVLILSMATMCVSAFSAPSNNGATGHIDYLDFSQANNAWSERYEEDVIGEDGKVLHEKGDLKLTSYKQEDYVDVNGKKDPSGVYPTAIFLEDKYSYDDNIGYTFKNDGEVAVFTANTADTTGMAFSLSAMFNKYIAKTGQIEYVKMRIKNNSASSKFSIGARRNFGTGSSFDSRTVTTFDIEPNMDGWTTYTFNFVDLNFDQNNGVSNWTTHISELLIFPFGYSSNNEGYEGAEIEVDYIVFGSLDYVSSYKSALEEKEDSATDFQFVTLPTTTTYYTGDKLNFDGFSAEITYSDGTKETVTSTSAIYNFEKPATVDEDAKEWTTKIQFVYGQQRLEHEVKVFDVQSVDFETKQETDVYNKIDILKAGKFTPVGLTLKVTFADNTTKVKDLSQFTLDGTDFSAIDVPLSENGYYEYIVTANYYGNTITFPVNLIDLKGLELAPIEDKKNSVYYGTAIGIDFFDVTCVYTDGSKKTLEESGLANDFSIACDTAIQGGDAVATAKIYNAAYGIDVAQDVNVSVQTPSSLEVQLSNANKVNVDSDIQLGWFTVSYKYKDGTTAELHNTDPNLIINYDTSAPGANTGKVKIGDMSATFNYTVLDAKFDAATETLKGELANRGTVKLLAPKFPTFWLVTIIVAAVVAVLVAVFCILKFVLKVEFKFKKFDLDEIF